VISWLSSDLEGEDSSIGINHQMDEALEISPWPPETAKGF
jgi:hypothetical protein